MSLKQKSNLNNQSELSKKKPVFFKINSSVQKKKNVYTELN